jgi:hypothetical protein
MVVAWLVSDEEGFAISDFELMPSPNMYIGWTAVEKHGIQAGGLTVASVTALPPITFVDIGYITLASRKRRSVDQAGRRAIRDSF